VRTGMYLDTYTYRYIPVRTCTYIYLHIMCILELIFYVLQENAGWLPGMHVDSITEGPAHSRGAPDQLPLFTREESEVFSGYTRSRVGEEHGDRTLEWAGNHNFDPENVHFRKIRTFSKSAVRAYIPGGVQRADFTEKLDGSQRLIFFFRYLYDAIKELLRNARFAGRQYTQAEIKFNQNGKRVYSAFNTGTVYEVAQLQAGDGASPVPVFLSSDSTLISKKMGGHPILRKSMQPIM